MPIQQHVRVHTIRQNIYKVLIAFTCRKGKCDKIKAMVKVCNKNQDRTFVCVKCVNSRGTECDKTIARLNRNL